MRKPPPLVCAGRAVDDRGQAVGDPCGNTFGGRGARDVDELRAQARARGWSVGGPAPMCDRCRKPDPAIARGLTTQEEK